MTPEDARNVPGLLRVPITEERLAEVTAAFDQTMELIRPLLNLDLPKEIETTTYLSDLAASKGAKGHETR